VNDDGCVYRIENTVNGRVYVGSTINLTNRTRLHWHMLKGGWVCLHNEMGADARRYGADKFIFHKLLVCEKSELHANEILFIDAYKMILGDKIYNDYHRSHNSFCLWTKTSKAVIDSECFTTTGGTA
jgi:group I intron endonuclease